MTNMANPLPLLSAFERAKMMLEAEKASRIGMHFKDVTKRTPELQEAANKLINGEITSAQYDALVNQHKPVTPYSSVPTPATREDAMGALSADKRDLYGVPSQTLQAGHPVGLRLDIPAYSNHGVWVPTVHEQAAGFGAGKSIGHESVASVLDPQFGMSEKAALSIAAGKPKGTIATIKGNWNPIDQQEALARANEYLEHPDWRQVGMDPERHSYFYDRATMEPITAADEALQVGPLVLAKNPVYGKKEDFKFADGGMITDTQDPAVEAMKDRVRDPQANEMLNLDLARLATMPHMAGGGSVVKATQAMRKAMEALEAEKAALAATKQINAADRAAAGQAAAAQIAAQEQLPMSEALGNMNAEGKRLIATQADRTRVGGGNIGGPAFSAISLADPNYANKVWGVGKQGTASALTNQNDANAVWTTLLGSEHQLKTNPLVFAKLEKAFKDSMKQGNLSPELEAKINQNLALTFGEGANIRDPQVWKAADTFEKRSALAELMMGQGRPPKEGGVSLGGEKSGKGVIFRPSDILKQETEPGLLHTEHGGDVPTFALGPRLFSLNGESSYRPDLHPGFPVLLHGEDFGYNVRPVPHEIALPDYNAEFAKRNPERTKGPGYYDLTMGFKGEGLPSQPITEDFLTNLQKSGFKDGGAVHMADGGDAALQNQQPILFQKKPEAPADNGYGMQDYMRLAQIMGGQAKDQVQSELESFKADPLRGTTDVLNRGMVATLAGMPVDIANMGLQGVDYLAGRAARNLGYDKPTQLSSETPIGGSEWIKNQMRNYGITSDVDRPMMEFGSSFINPFGAVEGAAAAVPKAGKALSEADRIVRGLPQPGLSIKAVDTMPEVNAAGFFSPAERAAQNLQRKSGQGQAFINDLLKDGSVRPEELNDMGLTDYLKARPSTTVDEVKSFIAQNKIPLEEKIHHENAPFEWKQSKDGTMWWPANIDESVADPYTIRKYKDEFVMTDENNRHKFTPTLEKAKEIAEHNARRELRDWDLPTGTAKYGPSGDPELTMPGGENYREVLLKLPYEKKQTPEIIAAQREYDDATQLFKTNNNVTNFNTLNEASRRLERLQQKADTNYYGSHWEEPNVLAHLRLQDFKDAEGKKTLLVDELQSDWHQAGRDQGYKLPPESTAPMDSEYRALIHKNADALAQGLTPNPNDVARAKMLEEQLIRSDSSKIPDAPFKDTWYQLGLKRAIKEAIDNGYDRIAITPGQKHIERYNLSNHIDRIDYNKNPDGTYNMSAIKNGQEVFSKEAIDDKELSNIIGKDVAKKIVGDEGTSPVSKADRWEAEDGDVPEFKSLSGLDLQVGGKGMKKYYDEIYPNYLKKFGKKHDANVGTTHIKTDNGLEPVHYMDITPQMREAYKTGMPMKKGGKVSFANSLDAMRHELTRNK